MKYAVLSMDIEDWYHLDYFQQGACDRQISLLDGLDEYVALLDEFKIKSSFFVVGELISQLGGVLKRLLEQGHDLGLHTHRHIRPMLQPVTEFGQDLQRAVNIYQTVLSQTPEGFRAPCFSLDRQRLDIVAQSGFNYDSSRIAFAGHPLYGTLDLTGFDQVCPAVFRRHDFFEFEVSTLPVLGKQIPVSGGGYLRIFPWGLMRRFIRSYLKHGQLYVMYLHPFELSRRRPPPLPAGTGPLTAWRFLYGRRQVAAKLRKLISMLISSGFELVTFSELRRKMMALP